MFYQVSGVKLALFPFFVHLFTSPSALETLLLDSHPKFLHNKPFVINNIKVWSMAQLSSAQTLKMKTCGNTTTISTPIFFYL